MAYPWTQKWFVITGQIPWHTAKLECRKRRDGKFDVQHPEGPIVTVDPIDVHNTKAEAEQALLLLVMDAEE